MMIISILKMESSFKIFLKYLLSKLDINKNSLNLYSILCSTTHLHESRCRNEAWAKLIKIISKKRISWMTKMFQKRAIKNMRLLFAKLFPSSLERLNKFQARFLLYRSMTVNQSWTWNQNFIQNCGKSVFEDRVNQAF